MITISNEFMPPTSITLLPRGAIFRIDNKIYMKSDELKNNCWNCVTLSEPDIGYIVPIGMHEEVRVMRVLSNAVIDLA